MHVYLFLRHILTFRLHRFSSSHEEPSGVPPSLKTQRTLEKVYTPPRTPPRTPQRSRSSTLEGLQRVSPSSDQFVTPTSTASPFREFFDSNPSHLPQTPSPVRVSMSVVRPIVMVSDSGVSPVSNISVHRSHASDTTPRNSLHGSRYLRSQISQASFSTQRSSAISTLAVHLHHEDLSSDTFGAARDSPVRPLAGWNCAPALEDGATEDEYAYETHQPNASLSPLRRKLSDLFLRSHEGETPASPRTPDTPTKRPIPLPDDPFRAN